MGKEVINHSYKNCVISLEEDAVTEYGKDDIKVYKLSEILAKFEGEEKQVDFSIKSSSEIIPAFVDGEEETD